jgi:hypothetical protein
MDMYLTEITIGRDKDTMSLDGLVICPTYHWEKDWRPGDWMTLDGVTVRAAS